MIISVHLPKTAGKSFEAALRARFGAGLVEDYGTFPMNTPRLEREHAAMQAGLSNAEARFEGVDCIHGHFLPVKYLLLASRRTVTFVTWVRHPVQRLVSNYHYWRRAYDRDTARELHRRVVEEDWPLDRFCLCEEMRDMYAQFLWAFPVDNFAFIGVTEHYDDDLADFARRHLGTTVTPERLNAGSPPGAAYDVDPVLAGRIEAFHARDMALYQRALVLRSERLSG